MQYEEVAESFIAKGIKVIIGEYPLKKSSESLDFTFVDCESSEISVRSAIKEAKYHLKIDKEKHNLQNNLQSIINNLSEGIIGFRNNDGKIICINNTAKQIFHHYGQETIQSLLPNLPLLDMSTLPPNGKIIKIYNKTLVFFSSPIMIDENNLGTILSVHEKDYIQMIDLKIRTGITNIESKAEGTLLKDSEKELIQLVLRASNNNREKAAALLGISPTTLWRRMKEFSN